MTETEKYYKAREKEKKEKKINNEGFVFQTKNTTKGAKHIRYCAERAQSTRERETDRD